MEGTPGQKTVPIKKNQKDHVCYVNGTLISTWNFVDFVDSVQVQKCKFLLGF